MTVLSDGGIKEAVESGDLTIKPFNQEQLQPASYDIRLGGDILFYDYDSVKSLKEGDTYRFQPGKRYLCESQEYFHIPRDMVAHLTGRSSIGRKFLIVHATAGLLDPDWEGTITLEVVNLSDKAVDLRIGQRIGQVVFHPLDKPCEVSYAEKEDAKYQGQTGPTKSRLEE